MPIDIQIKRTYRTDLLLGIIFLNIIAFPLISLNQAIYCNNSVVISFRINHNGTEVTPKENLVKKIR